MANRHMAKRHMAKRRIPGQVGYSMDFYPRSLGLSPTWGNQQKIIKLIRWIFFEQEKIPNC